MIFIRLIKGTLAFQVLSFEILRFLIIGLSSLGVPGEPWHPDQLNLSQLGGANYAHHITTGTPGFSDLPTALKFILKKL
jgi:hypothetical protein